MLRPLFLLLAATLPLLAATPQSAAAGDIRARFPLRATTHEWLYGVGRSNVLDTYLSPLEYTGTTLAVSHRSQRQAHWGRGRVVVEGYFGGSGAYLHSPTDDHKEIDAQLTAAVAWLRRWQLPHHWRLYAGGMGELTGGFTYNSNGGNNPAQGRLQADVGLSLLAEHDWQLARRTHTLRSQVELPLAGAMFSPRYGQSYYEIFSLDQSDHNVCFVNPFNAPSVRWTTTWRLPLLGATFTIGYVADVRQSTVNNLKRHAWNNQFVIGYVRRLHRLR